MIPNMINETDIPTTLERLKELKKEGAVPGADPGMRPDCNTVDASAADMLYIYGLYIIFVTGLDNHVIF